MGRLPISPKTAILATAKSDLEPARSDDNKINVGSVSPEGLMEISTPPAQHAGQWQKKQELFLRSRGRHPRKPGKRAFTPAGVVDSADSTQIPRVILHAILFKECQVFFLERFGAVVLFLPLNVIPDGLDSGSADGERAVTILPLESSVTNFLMHPGGGLPFHIPKQF